MRQAQGRLARVFRALGDDTRLQILALLSVRAACVCELVDLLDLSQPAVSEHLRRLREVGLVQDERRGVWTFYHRAEDLPDFVQAALAAVDLPGDLAERLARTPPADACARAGSGVRGRPGAGTAP
jgi:ArsR family transcriptional regulator